MISRHIGNAEARVFEQLLVKGQALVLEDQEESARGLDISGWEKKDGLWVVPAKHQDLVLGPYHDSKIAGYWGKHQTRELVFQNFVWKNWTESMDAWVASCGKCQRAKADWHSKKTKLTPMLTGTMPFEDIVMDFIGELPESEGHNAILVVTDRFTKMQLYIPSKTTWTSEDIANAYLCKVWKHFRLPRHVTLDQGPQFASAFT